MFCPMCGQENDDAAKFCGKCGTQLKTSAANVQKGPASELQPLPETDTASVSKPQGGLTAGPAAGPQVKTVSALPPETPVSTAPFEPANANADGDTSQSSPFPAIASPNGGDGKAPASSAPFQAAGKDRPDPKPEPEPYQEITDTFAHDLPSWDLEPPSTMVRRKKRASR